MRYTNCQLIPPTDGLTNPESAPIDASSFTSFSVQAESTGTIAGAFKVQGSNDLENSGASALNWTDMDAPFAILAPGTSLQFYINRPTMWVRLTFTSSGGAGNVSAKLKSMGY